MVKLDLIDREVLCGTTEELRQALSELGRHQAAFFCNVHMLMLSQENPKLARAMDRAAVVFPDGVPIAWMQRSRSAATAQVLRGYEAVETLCEAAVSAQEPIGLFGSTEPVLKALVGRLEQRFPGLQIGFVQAPPQFPSSEIALDSTLAQEINDRRLRYLFVGLGCPKQEIWIDTYAASLNCSLLGVGAAFDWLAGTTRKPPSAMEKAGLAWLYRLMQNPKRMGHRYFKYNTLFLWAFAKDLLFRRHSGKRKQSEEE